MHQEEAEQKEEEGFMSFRDANGDMPVSRSGVVQHAERRGDGDFPTPGMFGLTLNAAIGSATVTGATARMDERTAENRWYSVLGEYYVFLLVQQEVAAMPPRFATDEEHWRLQQQQHGGPHGPKPGTSATSRGWMTVHKAAWVNRTTESGLPFDVIHYTEDVPVMAPLGGWSGGGVSATHASTSAPSGIHVTSPTPVIMDKDIVRRVERYIEVKTTRSSDRRDFEMSIPEIICAAQHPKEYRVARVTMRNQLVLRMPRQLKEATDATRFQGGVAEAINDLVATPQGISALRELVSKVEWIDGVVGMHDGSGTRGGGRSQLQLSGAIRAMMC